MSANNDNNVNHKNKFHFDHIYSDAPKLYDSIILYQIGDLSCKENYVIGEHEQYCYEISFIVSGKGIYFSNGSSHFVKEGDIYLSLPGEIHNGKADPSDPFRYFYVGFGFHNPSIEQNTFYHAKKMFDQTGNPVATDRFNIKSLFLNVFNELINMNMYSEIMIKTFLHQIIILAYRNFFNDWERTYAPEKSTDNSKQIVYELINYVDVNLCNISELTEISRELGYSYYYLSHIFSRETGLSIKEYFNRKRFERAVELLKNCEMSVTQIADNLHYQSIHSFSSAFRKNFGVSPKEYQALYLKSKK